MGFSWTCPGSDASTQGPWPHPVRHDEYAHRHLPSVLPAAHHVENEPPLSLEPDGHSHDKKVPVMHQWEQNAKTLVRGRHSFVPRLIVALGLEDGQWDHPKVHEMWFGDATTHCQLGVALQQVLRMDGALKRQRSREGVGHLEDSPGM